MLFLCVRFPYTLATENDPNRSHKNTFEQNTKSAYIVQTHVVLLVADRWLLAFLGICR